MLDFPFIFSGGHLSFWILQAQTIQLIRKSEYSLSVAGLSNTGTSECEAEVLLLLMFFSFKSVNQAFSQVLGPICRYLFLARDSSLVPA